MNYSIKRFLLIYITLAIVLIYALIGFTSYQMSKEELDELYDANLKQVASAITAQHLAMNDIPHLYNNNQFGTEINIQGEEQFYVRILDKNGTVLYHSHSALDVPLPTALGFSTLQTQDKKWRFFVVNAKQQTIQVAQLLNLRTNTIKEIAWSLITSQLLFIPVLVLLIFLTIRKALLPLSALSNQIQQRESNDLLPFNIEKTPLEIKPLVQSLNVFMEKVSTMVSVLKRFTTDAAHELRTPITALKLQLTLIEQANTQQERAFAIKNMKNGIARSEQLVSQLLTLARIEPNNQTRDIKPFNLLSLAKDSIAELLPLAQEKNIDLGLITSDEIEVLGVLHELKILISNLIDNAIRYTPNNGRIDIAVFSNATNIIFQVADTGPGIPDEEIERVFERFYRGENNNISGSGLGLSIVNEIAIQHHAKVELINLNPGLSFKVIFTK